MKTRLTTAAALFLTAAAAAPADAPVPSPLDLRAAVGYALLHNFSILQAKETIRLEEGLVVQVRAQEIPNVSAQGQWQRNDTSISQIYPPANSFWNVGLKATQNLFAGGGIHASIEGAKLNRDAAAFDLQTTIDAALLDVRTKFYNVILNREKIGVEEENVKLYQHQLDDEKNQFESGSVSNFEVLRAKVALANAQPNLISARNGYRIAIEQLRQSIGAPGSAPFPEVAGDLDVHVASFDADTAIASAHEHRPELMRLSKLESAGERAVTSARAAYYPTVQAFGGYQWDGFNYVTQTFGAPSSANGWLFGLQSSWAIFDGRATSGRVSQAKSQLEQARLSRATEELEIDVEVRQTLSTLQEAGELVTASQQTVEQAEEALRLADAKFHAGSATQLDVLTSQVALEQAKTDKLSANYNYIVAVANVRKAIGLSDALVSP
ncbi:MAG TPA: TolC family protein [Opitutaceae bacterium]|jgi:outer membrane protein TolC